MDDLGDLAWKSAGLAQKPSATNRANTPLSQLSGGTRSGTSTPGIATPVSFSPASTPRMASATPAFMPSQKLSPQQFPAYQPPQQHQSQSQYMGGNSRPGANGTVSGSSVGGLRTPAAAETHSRSTSPGPQVALGSGAKSDDIFGNLVSFGSGNASKPQSLAGMSLDQQRQAVNLQQQQQQQRQQQLQAGASAHQRSFTPPSSFGLQSAQANIGQAAAIPNPALDSFFDNLGSSATSSAPRASTTSSSAAAQIKSQKSPTATHLNDLFGGSSSPVAVSNPSSKPISPFSNVVINASSSTGKSTGGHSQWDLDFLSGGQISKPASDDPFDIAYLTQPTSPKNTEAIPFSGDDHPLGILSLPVSDKPKSPLPPSSPQIKSTVVSYSTEDDYPDGAIALPMSDKERPILPPRPSNPPHVQSQPAVSNRFSDDDYERANSDSEDTYFHVSTSGPTSPPSRAATVLSHFTGEDNPIGILSRSVTNKLKAFLAPSSNSSRENHQPPAEPPSKPARTMTPKQQRPISHTPPPRRVTPPPRPVTPPRRVSPPPRPVTPPPPAVTATPNQLADSTAHKERGNESFKQGQFAEAEASYTAAITALPNGHLALIPLYNNRAAARLKTGHYREAIEDCTTVQELDKKDLKCLLRRATAWEAMEKWEGARDDYELIMSADSSIKAASQGLARCRKALQPPGTSPQVVKAAPPPKPSPPKRSAMDELTGFDNAGSSENAYVTNAVNAAVQKLRDQNQANEDEENLKLALKDQIDDQINRWRRGKEDNLRALISSLDSILWPELQWKSINLGELITPQQVKIKYMRAVSRVHPDKLSQDASVEHHLIASAVFSTLNKGWDAFKTQNGIS